MRRHRLNPIEVAPVKKLLQEAISLRCLDRNNQELLDTQLAFRFLYRLISYEGTPSEGPPVYPDPMTWGVMAAFSNGSIISTRGMGGGPEPLAHLPQARGPAKPQEAQ